MRTLKIILSVFLLIATVFSNERNSSLFAQKKEPALLADKLIEDFDKPGIPGGVVMVLRDGKVVYTRAFGLANLSWDIPFEVGTFTNIGSTAKQFTAFGIALLEEQGLLCIEDDVRKYIPELPEFKDTVRLRHLLSHTSGYREYINSLMMSGRHIGDYISRKEVITLLQLQPELQNKPGDTYNYNNSGYSLLATVIERVTEKDFPEWMKENIFDPLGMTGTLVRESPQQIIRGGAMGYTKIEDNKYTESPDIHAAMGAGGIYTTIGDLEKWILNFYTPVVGNTELIKKLGTPFLFNSGDTSSYAYGLVAGELNGLEMLQHGGADLAHRSNLMMFPEIRGAVVTQSNNSSFSNQIAIRLAETFFGDVMETEEREEKKDEADEFVYDAEKFDDMAGRYELEAVPGFVVEFTREGDKLYTQATGQPRFEIFASSDSTFYLTVVEASMTFHRNEDGVVDRMTMHQNGHHPANRIKEPAWEPSGDDLEMYMGRYFSEELETFYTVGLNKEGKLVLQHRRLADISLKAESKDEFTGDMPVASLRFLRADDGKVTGFEASSGRSFGIIFKKQ